MTIPHYTNLGSAIRGVCYAWCDELGYTDPFCSNGEWWAYPPNGVIPVKIKTVMGTSCQRLVRLGKLTLFLRPDGSLATEPESGPYLSAKQRVVLFLVIFISPEISITLLCQNTIEQGGKSHHLQPFFNLSRYHLEFVSGSRMLDKFSYFLVWDSLIKTHSLSVKLLEYGIYPTLVYDNWRSLLNYLLK